MGKESRKIQKNSREELLMIEHVLKGFHTQQHYACDMNVSPEEQHHLIIKTTNNYFLLH